MHLSLQFAQPSAKRLRENAGPLFNLRAATIAVIAVLALRAAAADQPATIAKAEIKEPDSEIIAANAEVLARGGRIRAQQKALAVLGDQPGHEADQVLLAQFDRYLAGQLPLALWLDLFEAAAKRDNADLKARLAERQQKLEVSHDTLTPYRECLEGGDADAGREIFMKKPEAGCIRCHRVGDEGGQIGPDLTSIHQVTERIFILESVVDPNAAIAPSFQNVMLTLKSGESVIGIASFESEEEVVITSIVDGKKRKVRTAEITERTPLPSAMPPGFGQALGKRAIRDLVEFLATME